MHDVCDHSCYLSLICLVLQYLELVPDRRSKIRFTCDSHSVIEEGYSTRTWQLQSSIQINDSSV